MDSQTLLLSKRDIASLLTIPDVLNAIEDVLRADGNGEVKLPPKISLNLGDRGQWPHHNAYLNAMPAYLGPSDIAGIKWAGAFWDNRSRQLPSVMALIILNDPATGLPVAVLDGAWITDIRTAAVSAIGAKYMAPQPIRTVALFGAGMQGRTHLLAFDALFKPECYKVFDVDAGVTHAYRERMQPQTTARIEIGSNVEETARDADVVVTATAATEPFLWAEHLKPGAHVCAIGSYPEIAADVIDWAERIVVDQREQTAHRGNLARFFENGRLTDASVAGTLGEVVAGKISGREHPNQNTLLVPIGMGSEDIAVAQLAYSRALSRGIGQRFDFGASEILV